MHNGRKPQREGLNERFNCNFVSIVLKEIICKDWIGLALTRVHEHGNESSNPATAGS
jgi:hypothetical protein